MNYRSKILASVAVSSLRLIAFDPGKAGWKMTADGKGIELKDGNPVWVEADGSEKTLGGDTISRLNGEAKGFRERAERAETALVPFKDIDPVKAKDAIAKVTALGNKTLFESGQVDELTNQIKATFTGQMTELQNENGTLKSTVDNMRIDGVFANSEFINEQVAMPKDFFQAAMRKHVRVKDGKIEMVDANGNPIYSKKRAGEYADPDEALALIVENHPQKATILRDAKHSGSGGGGGPGRSGQRTIKRSDWEAKPANERAADATAMGKGELTIVD